MAKKRSVEPDSPTHQTSVVNVADDARKEALQGVLVSIERSYGSGRCYTGFQVNCYLT